jgi:hypothetical protein
VPEGKEPERQEQQRQEQHVPAAEHEDDQSNCQPESKKAHV